MSDQISLFEFLYDPFVPKKVRLYQFFAGIGSQALALKKLGIEFEDYKIAEWAVPSIKAYNSIHTKDFTDYSKGKTREEMVKVVKNVSLDYDKPISEKQLNSKSDEWVREVYNNIIATHNLVNVMEVKGKDLEIDTNYTNIIFYSFPCQDLSKAGLRAGLKGGTRSGLLWEIERIINELTERERESCVLICENVPDLVGTNFVKDFSNWVMALEKLGFSSYDEILNSKDYCVPQNRKRVFMVSLPGKYHYVFPRKIKLKYRLNDFLQESADEKYYLSQKQIEDVSNWNAFEKPLENMERNEKLGYSPTITTRSREYAAGMILTQDKMPIKNNNAKGYELATDGDGIDISGRMQYHRGTVQKGLAQTLSTMGGNNVGVVVEERFTENELKLFTKDGNIKRYIDGDKIDEFKEGQMATTSFPNGYGHGPRTHNESIALNTVDRPVVKQNLRIRKLTPKECLRLMGFDDKSYESMRSVCMTDSQIYHCAGDSIVVTVLMGIFGTLLGVEDYERKIKDYANELATSK